MALKITIDIFSGRENPVIELTAQESLEALKQLKPIGKIEEKGKEFPPEPTLGYRGLIIEQTGKQMRVSRRCFFMCMVISLEKALLIRQLARLSKNLSVEVQDLL
jgi:hypothetical protein